MRATTAAGVRETRIEVTDNLEELLSVLPPRLSEILLGDARLARLIEVVADLGRVPEARFPEGVAVLSDAAVTRDDLDYVAARVGQFNKDNRAGIERTLHRISALRNRMGEIVGVTCRVGRAVYGTIDVVRDVVEAGKSVLLVGRPGVGKTTLLREAARVLADDLARRVMIVDTSNEIGGDGDIPHPGIGHARRIQVPAPELQHAVMIEAVENHMPQVVVIDEIGTEAEALAARTIAERGVQLIATAHGNSLDNLVANPTLSDLVGGIQAVTLGDDEARRRRTQKTVLERKAPPTFEVVVEIRDRDRFAVHADVATTVDRLLRHQHVDPEMRVRHADGSVAVEPAPALPERGPRAERDARADRDGRGGRETRGERTAGPRRTRIFPYALRADRVERAIRALQVPAVLADSPGEADVVLTLRAIARKQPRRLRDGFAAGARVYTVASSSPGKIEQALRELFELDAAPHPEQEAALREAEGAVIEVIAKREPVALPPRSAYLRRLQHQLANAYGLESQSVGREPFRHVLIRPSDA
ncbi:MAG: R3H domain-containing nucleic acid-binding protein [Deltaproteobacteria bacterium]|nr:R3H domain-containing nucleic acid-binding protein [Deltaproteobacteria bacterium]